MYIYILYIYNISKKSPTGLTEWTPKPEYLLALATYWSGSVGIRSHSIFDGIEYLNFNWHKGLVQKSHLPRFFRWGHFLLSCFWWKKPTWSIRIQSCPPWLMKLLPFKQTLLGQWLNFKLFGDYIFSRENKVQTFISGFHWLSEKHNWIESLQFDKKW